MINKCFEFKDYNHKRSDPNYTTVADFYHYCDNQNNVLKSLADCLLWQPSTDYTVGQIVRAPGMPTGHIAKCTTAGKSSEEEPAWTDGAVTDGTAKWRVYDPESATDDKITTASSKKLDKIGGAITGPISYDGTPKTDIELVNKSYVLAAIKSALDNDANIEALRQSIAAKQDKLTFDATPTENSTNPVTSDGIKKAIAAASAVAGVIDGDVSNANAWWVKLGGAVPLIIQGGRHTTGSDAFSLPIAYPNKILSTVATGEKARLTEFVKLISYNRTSIALQSISREGNDTGARPIQWISVGY